jgi:hypothetical protein
MRKSAAAAVFAPDLGCNAEVTGSTNFIGNSTEAGEAVK